MTNQKCFIKHRWYLILHFTRVQVKDALNIRQEAAMAPVVEVQVCGVIYLFIYIVLLIDHTFERKQTRVCTLQRMCK